MGFFLNKTANLCSGKSCRGRHFDCWVIVTWYIYRIFCGGFEATLTEFCGLVETSTKHFQESEIVTDIWRPNLLLLLTFLISENKTKIKIQFVTFYFAKNSRTLQVTQNCPSHDEQWGKNVTVVVVLHIFTMRLPIGIHHYKNRKQIMKHIIF